MGETQRFDLKRFRKDHKLTQKQICDALDYTQGFVSSMENGHDAIPEGFITKLCVVYNVPDPNKYMCPVEPSPKETAGMANEAMILHLIKQNEMLHSMLIEKDKTIDELRKERDELYIKIAQLGLK